MKALIRVIISLFPRAVGEAQLSSQGRGVQCTSCWEYFTSGEHVLICQILIKFSTSSGVRRLPAASLLYTRLVYTFLSIDFTFGCSAPLVFIPISRFRLITTTENLNLFSSLYILRILICNQKKF